MDVLESGTGASLGRLLCLFVSRLGFGVGGVDVRGLCTGCGVVSSGVGVRRGLVGSVPFTQVSNALFRDGRISFKAKGLFGLIASHRSGWRVSVAALAGCGREGRDAVRAGLGELEYFGYLRRERVRQADGTLGPVVYVITDQPAGDGGGSSGEVGGAALPPPSSPASPHAGSASLPADHKPNPAPTDAPQVGSALSLRSSAVTASSVSSRPGALSSGLPSGTAALLVSAGEPGELADRPVLDAPAQDLPVSDFPTLADPALAGTGGKNISNQKTKTGKRRGTPLPPGPARSERATGHGNPAPTARLHDTAPSSAEPAPAALSPGAVSPGVQLLERIGAANPPLRLTGTDLHAVAAAVDRLLQQGCSVQRVEHAIADRPLPRAVRTSVAAVIGARLRALGTPPGATTAHPGASLLGARCPDAARDSPPEPSVPQHPLHRPAPPPAGNTLSAPVSHVMVECGGCGRPGTVTGTRLCPLCLDWPACRSCTGPTPRRADPSGHGQCSACTQSSSRPAVQSGFGP